MQHLLRALPPLLLTCALAAQASYTTFGSSCGFNVCGGGNTAGGSRWNAGNNNRFALEFTVGALPMILFGFEIHTIANSGPSSTNAWIYLADTAGRPQAQPAQSALMSIGPTLDWYGTTFGQPTILQPNTKVFVSFAESGMDHPISSSGGTNVTHYYHGPSGPPWNGPYLSFPWKFRLLCASTGPSFAAAGTPRINNSFTLQLRNAAPVANTILFFGASNTNWGAIPLPVPLGFLGAGNCSLLVSIEAALPLVTDGSGSIDQLVVVPNAPSLVGQRFHNQWLIRHAAQNPAGIVLTNGGTGTVGL